MQYGYFDDDHREYVITRPDTSHGRTRRSPGPTIWAHPNTGH